MFTFTHLYLPRALFSSHICPKYYLWERPKEVTRSQFHVKISQFFWISWHACKNNFLHFLSLIFFIPSTILQHVHYFGKHVGNFLQVDAYVKKNWTCNLLLYINQLSSKKLWKTTQYMTKRIPRYFVALPQLTTSLGIFFWICLAPAKKQPKRPRAAFVQNEFLLFCMKWKLNNYKG